MVTFNKEEIVNDPVFETLIENIKNNHVVARHTENLLLKNRHIKDFCEQSRYYAELITRNTKTTVYISYDIASWIDGDKIKVRIESVTVYDDWNEYYIAKSKGLASTDHSEYPEQN